MPYALFNPHKIPVKPNISQLFELPIFLFIQINTRHVRHKKIKKAGKIPLFYGADEARTHDLQSAILALFQLSYDPDI